MIFLINVLASYYCINQQLCNLSFVQMMNLANSCIIVGEKKINYIFLLDWLILGCVQTDATTPNIVAPTMLGVVECVLAVVCKQMQQLPTMLGPAVQRGKDTTHKSL